MNLTKPDFIRLILLSVIIIFATTLVAVVLAQYGYLSGRFKGVFTTPQLIGLAAITALQIGMFFAHLRGYRFAAGVAILAISFFFPLYLGDDAFRYSMPQVIWLPFALAIALCSVRWAVLTFATTLAVVFVFFPVGEIKTPIASGVVTALIFVVLTFGKLLQQSLAEQARAAELTAKSVESALRKSEERYRTVFQHTVDAISISRIDDGSYLEVNSAFVDMLGYEPGEIVGKPAATLKIWAYPEELKRLLDLLAVHGEVMNFEARFRRKNGDLVWGVMSSRVIDIDGVRCRVAVTRNVTEQKKADELINFLAYFDPLTRLPNRTLLLDRLHQTMDANARSGVFGALLLIDLDDFRSLNDTRGHDCGDLLLKQVAERLPGCVQPGDTVARLGGDEFLVMLVALGRREQEAATLAEMTAEKIASVLSQEFPLIAENHRCTASIGVCLFKGAETDSEALLKQVELAMYRAKGVGRNLIRFFDPDMEVAIAKRAALEKDLRNALLGKQFVVHYQVQVTGERIVGVEALVRWQHPLRGMVSPANSSNWRRRPDSSCPWDSGSWSVPVPNWHSGRRTRVSHISR